MNLYAIKEGTKYDGGGINRLLYRRIEDALLYVEKRIEYLKKEYGDTYEKQGDVPYWVCDDYDFIQIEIFHVED